MTNDALSGSVNLNYIVMLARTYCKLDRNKTFLFTSIMQKKCRFHLFSCINLIITILTIVKIIFVPIVRFYPSLEYRIKIDKLDFLFVLKTFK